jgi:hypothetical protein
VNWLGREGATVKVNRESLRKMFPNLEKELQRDENRVQVNSVRTSRRDAEKVATSRGFDNYVPDVTDFIRRCDTEEQAEEIICYLERRGEIDNRYARKLRKQLRGKGVRSFGNKKSQDHYLKHGMRERDANRQ